MDPHTFMKSSVLVKWQYVSPVQTVVKIRKMQHTCQNAGYLDCVLEHAEVTRITRDFSALHKMPELAEPDVFVRHVESLEADLRAAEPR